MPRNVARPPKTEQWCRSLCAVPSLGRRTRLRGRASFVLAVATLSASLTGAKADPAYVRGVDLLTACNSPNSVKHAYCLGYIGGISDLAARVGSTFKICLPRPTTTAQLVGVAVDFLRDTPALSDQPAVTNVLAALQKGFPCR
jgi:hypothetical protein